jgi:hypothetical protein
MQDWEYGHESCCFTCPNKKKCSKPDAAECDVGVDSHKRDPLLKVAWDSKGPDLRCVYDVNKINRLEQIDNFKQKFSNNGKNAQEYNSILANYCQQASDTCVVDPETLEKMPKCSRLKSVGKDGELCRGWFNQQPKNVQDTVVQNYCAVHNTPDCKCVNRASNDIYRNLKVGKVINDGCWFVPCANGESYLNTSDVQKPSCPSNFCDVIYNFLKNRDVNITDVQSTINCVFKQDPAPSPPPPPKIVPPSPLKPIPPVPTPPQPILPPVPVTPQVPTLPFEFDIKKNYMIVVLMIFVTTSVVFKGSRDLIFDSKILGVVFVAVLGVNTFYLQKYLNDIK